MTRSALFLLALSLHAQSMQLPRLLISAGEGFASPHGKFAYGSTSSLILPQQTYTTVAIEDTVLHGTVQSCTLVGISKPIYQFGAAVTIGLTGLGGGCTSTVGVASATMSGQGFLYFRFGHTPWGAVVTVVKNSTGGYKVTLGISWGDYSPSAAQLREERRHAPPARELVCLPEDLGCVYAPNESVLEANPVRNAAQETPALTVSPSSSPSFDRSTLDSAMARIMAEGR